MPETIGALKINPASPVKAPVPEYTFLPNSGTYEVKVSVQTFIAETNGVLRSAILPAVTVPVHVR